MKRLAWHDSNRRPQELQESLVLAVLDSGETVMLQDGDERYVFIANLPPVWTLPSGEDIHPTADDIFGSAIGKQLGELRAKLREPGNRAAIEIVAGEDQTFQFQLYSTVNAAGGTVIKTTIREVTVERRREQLLRTLLREVSHRSKNLMAIIQSLSDQTARFSLSKEEFIKKFRGRLYALAQSQDLLTDSDWRGANIFNLLDQQVALYLPEFPNLVSVHGENVFLNPNGAMYMGLAFHELVVNTVTHTRNLVSHPVIVATCYRDAENISFHWHEPLSSTGQDGVKMSGSRSSFGSVVLEKVVPVALNGKATYQIADDAIIYELTFPIGSLA